MVDQKQSETLLIVDYGSQYTQLIARRCRELGVFSIIVPYNEPIDKVRSYKPLGIILSGGPNSVYEAAAPKLNTALLELNVPILGICYGLQLLAIHFGGQVISSTSREYGQAKLDISGQSMLLSSTMQGSQAWMSHGDHVVKPPSGFSITATSGGIICGIEDKKRRLFGLQFHPEVTHSKQGAKVLKKFLKICDFSYDWSTTSYINEQIENIRKIVGSSQVLCALSGGVDSSVAATLVDRAIGSQQTCVFVDNGLLRQDEYHEVLAAYKSLGMNVKAVRASNRFLNKLKGVTNPEQKRKIIGTEFIAIFEAEARKIKGDVKFLVQGTLYTDVIESKAVHGPSHTIKSHHNVGGLPKKMKLQLIEPLRELFKDEARATGTALGLPDKIVGRQPFPGPGLAIRIIGEITKQNLALLLKADAIVREEIENHPIRPTVWQFFVVLLPISSVGVMGDMRTYEQVAAIRAVETTDGMTADWAKLPYDLLGRMSSRIVSEVRGINRVVYDITSKPPGTIEWE